MRRSHWRRSRWVVVICAGLLARSAATAALQAPAPAEPEGAQVLTQGPIHEAFAAPIVFDPKPGLNVAKSPPAPVPEMPPDQKPEGENVQWIPGYWAWDDGRNDFLWVSGVWRAVPPGRQWVPGYWQQVDGGFQWVHGYWSAAAQTPVQYLPAPPASLEAGPSSPPPSADAAWAPGSWVWQQDQYLWRPGFWVENQPGWMWVPAYYSWTPSGYVANPGYWDYPLINRGVAFAPVYFAQPVYAQPSFFYTPAVSLVTPSLYFSLFVRPAYHTYYFGDYYAASYYRSGIYPWYSFHGSRYGYDPLYAYSIAQYSRTNPHWSEEIHSVYSYRREHPEFRPPHTYAESERLAARTGRGPGATASAVLARPLSQVIGQQSGGSVFATGGRADVVRYERIDEARRQEYAEQAARLHQFREARSRLEHEQGEVRRPAQAPALPRHIEMPRSPIIAPIRREDDRFVPPSPPAHPEVNRAARPASSNALPTRHEPRPENRPPAHYEPAHRRR